MVIGYIVEEGGDQVNGSKGGLEEAVGVEAGKGKGNIESMAVAEGVIMVPEEVERSEVRVSESENEITDVAGIDPGLEKERRFSIGLGHPLERGIEGCQFIQVEEGTEIVGRIGARLQEIGDLHSKERG